jgi:pSer/pThr/pTyr-binding forkhead associated (FHA) protein
MSKATEIFEQYTSLRLQGQTEDEAQGNLVYGIRALPIGSQVSLKQRFQAWESERTVADFDIAERSKLSNITMKIVFCSNCDSPNVVGVARCQVCDTPLEIGNMGDIETILAPTATQTQTQTVASVASIELEEEKSPPIVLHSVNAHRQFALRPQLNSSGLRLGRVSPSSPVEVDLNEIGAADLGVSRLHALMQYDNNNKGIYITDLNSTNGTYVNGFKLPANARSRLRDGDELQLGHLKLTVRFNEAGA